MRIKEIALRKPAQAANLLACCLALLLCACAVSPPVAVSNGRQFEFSKDTFAFGNELTWTYQTDPATGTTRPSGHNPDAHYTLHCFVLARSARQFFQFARFAPGQPRVSDAEYRALVRAVIAHDPSQREPVPPVEIPGYADLRGFSADKEPLLKGLMGSAMDSYFQRGNWRMVFPIPRGEREQTASQLLTEIRAGRPPVVHVFRFPDTRLNHAILIYEAADGPAGPRFLAYDPNNAAQPTWLDYDSARNEFSLPPNTYFAGGAVKVYRIYRSVFY